MLKEILRFGAVGILLYWVASKIKTGPNLSMWQTIGFLIVLFIAYLILEIPNTKEKTEANSSLNDDDDIFLDNAPNPTPPPTNPPTSEQIEFMEFMKQKRQEQEREKELIRRE